MAIPATTPFGLRKELRKERAGGAAENPDAGPWRRALVKPEAIKNLAAFLDETDWQLIYGLNLGQGSPQQAAEEAKFVSDSVRHHRLVAFQIGNEPDLYHRNRHSDVRGADWNFDSYFAQWQEFAKAVRKAVPKAVFGAPDIANVANGTSWIEQFVEKATSDIVLVSGHYYAEGPPEDPRMTIDHLLQRDPRLLTNTPLSMEISRKGHHPFRMTEGNSCYNGGKRDVSDTFASALWAADYMLYLAQSGYCGVNFRGGGNGIYTPIAGDAEHGFSARPIYYGMLLGEQFAGSTMLGTHVKRMSQPTSARPMQDSASPSSTKTRSRPCSQISVSAMGRTRQSCGASLHPVWTAKQACAWRAPKSPRTVNGLPSRKKPLPRPADATLSTCRRPAPPSFLSVRQSLSYSNR